MCRMSASVLQYLCNLTPLEMALVRYVQYGYIIGMECVLSTFHGISSFHKQVQVYVRIANTQLNLLDIKQTSFEAEMKLKSLSIQ